MNSAIWYANYVSHLWPFVEWILYPIHNHNALVLPW